MSNTVVSAVNPASASPSGLGHDVTKSASPIAPGGRTTPQILVEEPGGGQYTVPIEKDTELKGIYIEGLGNLDDLAKVVIPEDTENDGEGQKVVILHNLVTGVDGIYRQGTVVRVSKLAPSWGKDKTLAARQIKRLFTLEAIREANDLEQDSLYVELSANAAFELERNKRQAAQAEIERLRLELAEERKIKGDTTAF